jgi:hypothetical protein
MMHQFKAKLLALHVNFRLDRKGLPGTNTVAYFVATLWAI